MKALSITCLFNVLYTSLMGLTSATGAMNSMLVSLARDSTLMFFEYWVPTYVYLLSVVVAFSVSRRWMVSAAHKIWTTCRLCWVHVWVSPLSYGTCLIQCCSTQAENGLICQPRWILRSWMHSKSTRLSIMYEGRLWHIQILIEATCLFFHVQIATASGAFTTLTLNLVNQFELREYSYLSALRHLEVTAKI